MMESIIYLVRRKSDGLFYRKPKKKYGKTVRTAWTKDPAMAWHSHDKDKTLYWFNSSLYHNGDLGEFDVVAFKLTEV